MAALRRSMRLCATVWLVFQVAWLTTFMPRDCCEAHQRVSSSCHDSVSATHCPMPSTDGTPCPMHRGRTETRGHDQTATAPHDHRTSPALGDCRLTGTCDGPTASIFTVLSNYGVLPEPGMAAPSAQEGPVATLSRDHVIRRFEPPDPPPPRV